jgi:hypothetical protein
LVAVFKDDLVAWGDRKLDETLVIWLRPSAGVLVPLQLVPSLPHWDVPHADERRIGVAYLCPHLNSELAIHFKVIYLEAGLCSVEVSATIRDVLGWMAVGRRLWVSEDQFKGVILILDTDACYWVNSEPIWTAGLTDVGSWVSHQTQVTLTDPILEEGVWQAGCTLIVLRAIAFQSGDVTVHTGSTSVQVAPGVTGCAILVSLFFAGLTG